MVNFNILLKILINFLKKNKKLYNFYGKYHFWHGICYYIIENNKNKKKVLKYE